MTEERDRRRLADRAAARAWCSPRCCRSPSSSPRGGRLRSSCSRTRPPARRSARACARRSPTGRRSPIYGLARVLLRRRASPASSYALFALVVPPGRCKSLVVALLLPYSLFFAATLHVSDYVSYRDVFHANETLAPLLRGASVAHGTPGRRRAASDRALASRRGAAPRLSARRAAWRRRRAASRSAS